MHGFQDRDQQGFSFPDGAGEAPAPEIDRTAREVSPDSAVSSSPETEPAEDGTPLLPFMESAFLSTLSPAPLPDEKPEEQSPTLPAAAAEEKTESAETKALSLKDIQRAVLAWLVSQNPAAAALHVQTRASQYKSDAAAFWTSRRRKKMLSPERSVLVEARHDRDACWPDCSDRDEILPALREIQEKRAALEARIRELEPELRDNEVLFPEIEIWDYEKTRSEEYHACRKQLKEYEAALYKGSRFERIREAETANELYLAVPAGMVQVSELAEGWGLLYVHPDLSVELIHPAEKSAVTAENQLFLARNIASSAMKDVLFSHGIQLSENGKITMRRPPKRRPVLHTEKESS